MFQPSGATVWRSIDADALFLRTLDDLKPRASSVGEYELLMAAPLLRKLLLDGGASLVDQVNRDRRLKLRFWALGPTESEDMILSFNTTIVSLGEGLDPADSPNPSRGVTMTRDQLMARRVMVLLGEEYTVADTISLVANKLGGVHLDDRRTDREHILGLTDKQLEVGGMPAVVQTMKGITRVVIRGLHPLRARVRRDHELRADN